MQQIYQLYLQTLRPDGSLADRIIADLEAIQRSPAMAQSAPLRRRYTVFARLINLRLPLPDALLQPPVTEGDLPDGLADLPFPDPQTVTQAQASLATDPCRPDLWLVVALGRLRSGDTARAQHLLRRLAASGYPERAQAQDILARSVALAYRSAA